MDRDPRIDHILERNERVEMEKAWETSWARRLIIAGMTYAIATIFLWGIGIPLPSIQSLVPTGGYLLSTLSLPWAKKWWIARKERKRGR